MEWWKKRASGNAVRSAERLFTAEEAAGYLRVSPKTLEAWRTHGGGPTFVRLRGRAIRYRHNDLEKFVSGALFRSTSQGAPAGGVS